MPNFRRAAGLQAGGSAQRVPLRHMLFRALFCGVAVIAVQSVMAGTPDLNGIWKPIDPPSTLRTTDGTLPPLLPADKAVYERHVAARAAGDLSFDTTDKCLPPGTPRILYMGPFEIVQQPAQVTMLYQWNRLVRTILMNVPHRAVAFPTYEGQSTGKWVHGDLVVDSIGFRDSTTLDAAGLPHSDALHVTETYKPAADGQHMTVLVKVQDPKSYARPWTTRLELQRDPAGGFPEDVCLERKGIHWGALRKTGVDKPPEG